MTLEATTTLLSKLSISIEQKSHNAVDSLKSWVETVKSLDVDASPCKTLVLKPSKGPNSNLIFVISQDSTALSVGLLAKSLGYKDARMAQDDVVNSTFGIDKINCKILLLENAISLFAQE
jgi:prolyl-tRNA synthetase